jgi:hypothetical protein
MTKKAKAALIIVAFLFALYVCPTPYRDGSMGGATIRINRFTGSVEIPSRGNGEPIR